MNPTRLIALATIACALVLPSTPAQAALQPVAPAPVQLTPGSVLVRDPVLNLAQPDATVTRGWVTGTIYFNIVETMSIANGWGGAAIITAACTAAGSAIAGPVGAAAMAAGCGVSMAAIVYYATVANNNSARKCLNIKFPLTIVFGVAWLQPGVYFNGYCHW